LPKGKKKKRGKGAHEVRLFHKAKKRKKEKRKDKEKIDSN